MAESWTVDDGIVEYCSQDIVNQFIADQATEGVFDASDLVTTKFSQDLINTFIAKDTTYAAE